jgi:bacterial/archaeal transporter family protein
MQWIAYALVSVALWGGWAFFGKLSLRHASWAQVSFVYGAITVLLFGALLLGPARRSFSGANGWALAASGLCGALGLATFYLALDRGKASAVVPLISIYPLITAALAVVFLNETLTALQMAGVGCALGGVVLIGLGS